MLAQHEVRVVGPAAAGAAHNAEAESEAGGLNESATVAMAAAATAAAERMNALETSMEARMGALEQLLSPERIRAAVGAAVPPGPTPPPADRLALATHGHVPEYAPAEIVVGVICTLLAVAMCFGVTPVGAAFLFGLPEEL